jgi:hypothetical protein
MKRTRGWRMPCLIAAAAVALVPAGLLVAAPAAANASAARPATPTQYPSVSGRFYAIAASSASNVWAVGLQPTSSLIEHWNGQSWTMSFNAPVGYFLGAAATSASNAWAVGGTNWGSPTQTLIEHWNGKSWSQVPSPSPSVGGYLGGVTATSASNAWAVGQISLAGPGGTGYPLLTIPLIEHWNGRAWTQQAFSEPEDGGQFNAVAATSARNAWAVGFTDASRQNTLIEHWNGSNWTRVPSPTAAGGSYLNGVSVTSSDNAWAVGYSQSGGKYKSLALHWNGRKWAMVASPNPTGDTDIVAVSASSSGNAWMSGYTNPTTCSPTCGSAIFHWNGKYWAAVSSPNAPGYLNVFEGVLALSGNNAWAVGTTSWSSTLIAHWNGKTWS